MAALTLAAEIASVVQGIGFVADCAAAAGLPPDRITKIELVVEEALVNICQHAYLDIVGTVDILCTQGEAQQFLIELIDTGKPFNMLMQPLPDLSVNIEQRPLRGLGVLLMRSLVDAISYRREDNRNILQLVMRPSP
jgi:anti-sigma regulatory factor (Ser/Thr protein kinase)